MSVLVLNTKSVPQPWMSYRCGMSRSESLNCCSELITETESLLPFQIITSGPFETFELSPYGENDWTVTPITVTSVTSEGLYIISYDGTALDTPLSCGTYDARLTAGDVWYFAPITVKDFAITENMFTKFDDLMLPLKFTEQVNSGMRVIAPCDSFLPWMYSTLNPTTAPAYYLVDENGTETLLAITVDVMTIEGRTYYIHDGACFYPFLSCGDYYLKIVDGAYTYYSVWFRAERSMNDIPDGYRAVLDVDRHIIFDENCDVIIEECSDIPPDIIDVNYGYLYNWYASTDVRNITADGWRIPTWADWSSLSTYIGGDGGKLREIGTIYWMTPNTGATNEYEFNGRGNGIRQGSSGTFISLRQNGGIWLATSWAEGYYIASILAYNTANISYMTDVKNGQGVRVCRNTALSDGEKGLYTGNDGKVYETICINGLEWLSTYLTETKYRNGDSIPEVTDNAAWAALPTGARCSYNNDESNALTI